MHAQMRHPAVPTPYDHMRDRRTLLIRLWNLQNSHCACCGRETQIPRTPRGKDAPAQAFVPLPHHATFGRILLLGDGGENVPENLLMTCYGCAMKRKSSSFEDFMTREMKELPALQQVRVREVESALLPYFYAMAKPGQKGPVNAYVTLGLARRFNEMARKNAAAEDLRVERMRSDRITADEPAVKKTPAPQKDSNLSSLQGAPDTLLQVLEAGGVTDLTALADLATDELMELLPQALLTEQQAGDLIMEARRRCFGQDKVANAPRVLPVLRQHVAPTSPIKHAQQKVETNPKEPSFVVETPVSATQTVTANIRASSTPVEESEIEECYRLTKEVQELIANHKTRPYMVVETLRGMELILGLHDEALMLHVFNQLNMAIGMIGPLDGLLDAEIDPALAEAVRKRLDAGFFNPAWIKTHVVDNPEGYSVVSAQLRVQSLLATATRLVRLRMAVYCKHLMQPWEMPLAERAAIQTFNLVIAQTSQLQQCFATYPRLRQLVR